MTEEFVSDASVGNLVDETNARLDEGMALAGLIISRLETIRRSNDSLRGSLIAVDDFPVLQDVADDVARACDAIDHAWNRVDGLT